MIRLLNMDCMIHFKRVFELNPGEHFIYFGKEYKVMKIENGVVQGRSTQELSNNYITFGCKSLEHIEVIPNNKDL